MQPRVLYPVKQRYIIRRMFGGIGQYRVRHTKVSIIAKELGVRYHTVFKFVRTYERQLGVYPWPSNEAAGRHSKLDEYSDYLLLFATLVEWRGLPLKIRCAKLF